MAIKYYNNISLSIYFLIIWKKRQKQCIDKIKIFNTLLYSKYTIKKIRIFEYIHNFLRIKMDKNFNEKK